MKMLYHRALGPFFQEAANVEEYQSYYADLSLKQNDYIMARA
jgi:hypothetical protein